MILLGVGAGMAFNPVLLAAMSDVEPDGDLRPMLGQVAAAMWQVMAVGTPEQQAAAKEAVVELRKKLYGILAAGSESTDADEDRR